MWCSIDGLVIVPMTTNWTRGKGTGEVIMVQQAKDAGYHARRILAHSIIKHHMLSDGMRAHL